jgi:F-box protein 9
MSSQEAPKDTDAELEAFRRQWRAEVESRNKHNTSEQPTSTSHHKQPHSASAHKHPHSSSSAPKPRPHQHDHQEHHDEDEVANQVYYDLPDKDADLRLDAYNSATRDVLKKEPGTALEHYEKAVEKETMGSLGDSVDLYRTAFRMDDAVHEKYKNKHFPPSAFPPKPKASAQQPNPSNASQTVPGTAHHSSNAPPPTLTELVDQFSHLFIPGAPAPTDADPPPPCPIAELPGEILSDILTWTAVNDLASLAKVSLVCKRFAYLVMTDEAIWKRVAQGPEFGFGGMHYNYACNLKGEPLEPALEEDTAYLSEGQDQDSDSETQLMPPPRPSKTTPEIDNALLHSLYSSSWRQMFRSRPRLRFNGCYISTVNYQRPGATNTSSSTWGTPILIVTYFRYLRFFRDGTCISLLTTTEPIDVVHHLTKENMRSYASGSLLPNSVMKDALRGRWRLSGPGNDPTSEIEGDVHIETDGVIPKYMWKMQFGLGSRAKKSVGGHKLTWKGFWSYNRLTDDWGEFGLKNDKAFLFSRVRGYGMGY